MTPSPGTYPIGPQTGQLLLRTGREGVASKVGHDLTITFDEWSGEVVIGEDVSSSSVAVSVSVRTFHILEGTGGALPLGADDKKDIAATAMRLLGADQQPTASFTSSSVQPGADGGTIEGTLALAGGTAPISLVVTGSGDSAWHATSSVLQTSLGIKPYKAFFGALRLADRVGIEVDVTL